MTSTLYVFGDSFGVSPDDYKHTENLRVTSNSIISEIDNPDMEDTVGSGYWGFIDGTVHPTYIEDVGNRLGCTHVSWNSLPGVSNDWIFSKIYENYKDISANDYAVIMFTNMNRRWFFEAHQSNLTTTDTLDSPHVRTYLKYLQNNRLDTIITLGYILATRLLLKDRCPYVILPAYPIPETDIKGCLDDVSKNEITGPPEAWLELTAGFDPRINHLSISNHRTLSIKIYNYFINNIPIDLTTEFLTNIIKVNQ